MSHRGCGSSATRKLARNGDVGSYSRVLGESSANRKLSTDHAVKSWLINLPVT